MCPPDVAVHFHILTGSLALDTRATRHHHQHVFLLCLVYLCDIFWQIHCRVSALLLACPLFGFAPLGLPPCSGALGFSTLCRLACLYCALLDSVCDAATVHTCRDMQGRMCLVLLVSARCTGAWHGGRCGGSAAGFAVVIRAMLWCDWGWVLAAGAFVESSTLGVILTRIETAHCP